MLHASSIVSLYNGDWQLRQENVHCVTRAMLCVLSLMFACRSSTNYINLAVRLQLTSVINCFQFVLAFCSIVTDTWRMVVICRAGSSEFDRNSARASA